ncbi:MAG: Trm112 family protein [Planctomycetota bacterium]|jgi:uncharacterized protein YbaR (Trm112 family)
MIDQALLEILACPLDKAPVRPEKEGDVITWLVCEECGRRYPVRDDMPVMLPEEAELPGASKDGGGNGGNGGDA